MKNIAQIVILDEVHCILGGMHPSHLKVLVDEFALPAANYFFNPKYKLGRWDGKINFVQKTGKTYVLLLPELLPRIKELGYKLKIKDKRAGLFTDADPVDEKYFENFLAPNGKPFILRYYQHEAVNSVIKNGFGIIIAGTGAGKAQPMSCKVLTPTGWRMMRDIMPGDVVINPSGGISNVVKEFPQGVIPTYRIKFHDGSSTKCCLDHLWQVNCPVKSYRANTKQDVMSTQDIIQFLDKKQSSAHVPGNISIPLYQPSIGNDAKVDMIVDPYLLGVLLGDGGITRSCVFSSADDYIVNKITDIVSDHYPTINVKYISKYDYRISGTNVGSRLNPLTHDLRELGVFGKSSLDKFIPESYISSPDSVKVALLQGLMDTDGTVDKRGNCSYTSISKILAEQVQIMLWSLGATCTMSSRIGKFKGKSYNEAYTLFFNHTHVHKFFSIARKKDRCLDVYANGRVELNRRVVDITQVESEDSKCIMLDSENQLYVTDDYIVTHNTIINACIVDNYGKDGHKTLTIVPTIDLVGQTIELFRQVGLDVGEYSGEVKDVDHTHVVSTWQSLQNNPKIMKLFSCVVVDECHQAKATVIKKLMVDNGHNIVHRFGLTGTMPKDKTDNLTVRCSIGPVRYTIPSHVLIDQKYLASLKINILQMMEYLPDDYFPDYQAEKKFLLLEQSRQEWICDQIYAKSQDDKGNTLVLVNSVAYGRKLQKAIPESIFLARELKAEERKMIFDAFEDHDHLVVIATVQLAGTGISIDRIFNLFFIDMGKSFIRTIQSIGRGLRRSEDKEHVNVFDICANLVYSAKHLRERIKYYKESKYPYTKKTITYKEEE